MPSNKPLPIADLSMYLFHGGPRVEDLFGGVLNGEFVRGGRLWETMSSSEELANLIGRTTDGGNMPDRLTKASGGSGGVLSTGTDVSQSHDLLNAYEKRVAILKDSSAHTAEEVTAAREFVQRNRDIISGVLSGQVHMTGIRPTAGARE